MPISRGIFIVVPNFNLVCLPAWRVTGHRVVCESEIQWFQRMSFSFTRRSLWESSYFVHHAYVVTFVVVLVWNWCSYGFCEKTSFTGRQETKTRQPEILFNNLAMDHFWHISNNYVIFLYLFMIFYFIFV